MNRIIQCSGAGTIKLKDDGNYQTHHSHPQTPEIQTTFQLNLSCSIGVEGGDGGANQLISFFLMLSHAICLLKNKMMIKG